MAVVKPPQLNIPARQGAERNTPTRPKEAAAWLEGLPAANVQEMGQKLCKTLATSNRSLLPPLSRLQIADLFASPIQYCISTLERNFAESAFPLSVRGQRLSDLCVDLRMQLATAYKIVVAELSGSPARERKLLPTALHRTASHLGEVIYQNALVYAPTPAGVWRELHEVFRFGLQCQYASVRIGHEDRNLAASTLQDLYSRSLLFALASPFQLRQQDIHRLYKAIPEWSSQLRLQPLDSGSKAQFVARLDSDSPPRRRSQGGGDIEGPIYGIDTDTLVQRLGSRLADLSPDADARLQPPADTGDLTRGLTGHLITAWSASPRRRFPRTRLNFDLQLTIGLANIHQSIMAENEQADQRPRTVHPPPAVSPAFDEKAPAPAVPGMDLSNSESGLTLVPLAEPEAAQGEASDTPFGATGETYKPSAEPAPANGPTVPQLMDLRTVNESIGGYCVEWNRNLPGGIRIGELLGIKATTEPPHFRLAVSRWIKSLPDGTLNLGIQFLAPNTLAVEARMETGPASGIQPALLTPELKTSSRPASLITHPVPFRSGMTLLIGLRGTEQRVRLQRLLEANAAFSQFKFIPIAGNGTDPDRDDNDNGSKAGGG